MSVSVLLSNPKFDFNVGNTLRACALLGAERLYWTGYRVDHPERWGAGARLPREERMKCYDRTALTALGNHPHPVEAVAYEMETDGMFSHQPLQLVPVCIEITPGAEDLRSFIHPPNAVYVFGPEDGGVEKGLRSVCHRFVRIPTADPTERTPYNLAAAVNIVLFHRLMTRSVLTPTLSERLSEGY